MTILRKLKPFLAPLDVKFVDPDTGYKYHAKTRVELKHKIYNYRMQNDLPQIENIDLVLEDYWCTLPLNKALCETCPLERGIMGYLKGGINLFMSMAFKSYVETEEAERRATICDTCIHNKEPENPSSFRSWTDTLALHTIGERKTSKDDNLHSCEICTCVLRCKVWNGGSLKESEEINKQFPDYCWAKEKVNG